MPGAGDLQASVGLGNRGTGAGYHSVFDSGRLRRTKCKVCCKEPGLAPGDSQTAKATKQWQEKYLRPAHDGFARIRIHDLKHTFGRRLRAAGVTEEDRKALLGHKNGSITSHYFGAELGHLIEAANKVSVTDSRAPALTILKRKQE